MKIMVVGLGSMGKRRIRLIQAMHPEDILVGVDKNPARIQDVKDTYHIECYDSIEGAITKEAPECAFVCTAPISHGPIIKECLQSGLHIFTEINLLNDHYEENMRLAKEKNCFLFLSSTPVYRGEIKKIKETVQSNQKPVHYIYHVGQYLPDWHPWENYKDFFVGDVRTNGCREIFAIEMPWMIGTFGKVKSFHVLSRKLTGLELKCDDSYLVQLEHENGTQGIFAVDITCREAMRKLEIYNEDLYLEWKGKPDTLMIKDLESGELKQIPTDEYQNVSGYSQFVNEYAYVNELNYFFEKLKEYQVNGEEALRDTYGFKEDFDTLELIDKIENRY